MSGLRAVLAPDLGLVDLAVLGVQDGAALVAISAEPEILDDDEPDDGLVLVGALAFGACLRLALRVIRFGEADDLAEELAPLLIQLDFGRDPAALLIDGLPLADRRIRGQGRTRADQDRERHRDTERRPSRSDSLHDDLISCLSAMVRCTSRT